jgi:two-component system, cell cycle sensor histidine kinase and response regulator CckA
MIYIDLIFNLALLVALSVVSGFIEHRLPKHTRSGALMQGILFGGAAVIGMLRPLDLGSGLIFDGRSVMVSLCALFFGSLAGLMAALMTVGCRIWLGGVGMLMGVLVILSSTGIGLMARFLLKPEKEPPSTRNLYLFGLAVHLAMIALMFSLPSNMALTVMKQIGPPVILLYPLATILVGKILSDQVSAMRFVADLQQTKQNLDITLQAMGEAVISTNLEGKVVFMNPVAETLTGWKKEKAQRKSLGEIFNIVNTQARGCILDQAKKVLTGDYFTGLDDHTLLITRNGSELHITISTAPIRDAEGKISGVVLALRDVTEAYQLIDGMNDIVFVTGPDGKYVEVNKTAVEMLGYSREELLSMGPVDIDPYLVSEDIIKLAEGMKSDKRQVFETRYRTKNGTVIPVEVSSNHLTYGGNLVILSIARNITERKEAESERERLIAAIENVGEIIFITDPDGTIQYVNPAFERITGYTKQEVVGQTPRLLNSGHQDKAFYREMWKTISGGDIWQGKTVNKRKDGTFYTEEATISSVKDNSGKIINYVAVAHDITAHLRLMDQFQQAQKMESVGRLAGGVAHDYNNILSVILGFAELAMDKVNPTEPLYEDLQEIYTAAKRSADIT